MTPPPWIPAGSPGSTARHARSPRRRRRTTIPGALTSGHALAATVVAVGLAGGFGTGAAVGELGDRGGRDARGMAVADVDEVAPAPQGGGGPQVGAPVRDGAAAAGGAERASSGADDAGADDVGAAAKVAGRVEAAADALRNDVRPLPVPGLVARDTVGPVWLSETDRADGLLAIDVPEAASGVLDVVPGSQAAPGTAPVRTVGVEVERGLPVDGAAFAATVMTTLNDPRGWGAQGAVTFARTDGPADIRVVLASPATVDAMCAPLPTAGQVSCGRNGYAALNFRRWVQATDEFADRHQYRQYLVNHEVGHLLGHAHQECPGPGQPAPLMQQQSYTVAPCTPNGWPFP